MAGEELSKIRDILVGTQLRALEDRMDQMEKQLQKRSDYVQHEMGRQYERLEQLITSHVSELTDKLATEKAVRAARMEEEQAKTREWIDERVAFLLEAIDDLRTSKSDRQALAKIFSDVAARLEG
ncbi:MAG: hypothetical protein AAF752_15160 [Bacteroidota bacterium]